MLQKYNPFRYWFKSVWPPRPNSGESEATWATELEHGPATDSATKSDAAGAYETCGGRIVTNGSINLLAEALFIPTVVGKVLAVVAYDIVIRPSIHEVLNTSGDVGSSRGSEITGNNSGHGHERQA